MVPMTNSIAQMMSALERIRIAAWRNTSLQNFRTSGNPRIVCPENRRIWPPVAKVALMDLIAESTLTIVSAGCGGVRRPLPGGRSGAMVIAAPSPEDLDVRVEAQQDVREHYVEQEDQSEGDHDRLVDGATHADQTALGSQALVAAH